MRKIILLFSIITLIASSTINSVMAQEDDLIFVHVTKLKAIMPEDDSFAERDSLLIIYHNNVVAKNDLILSHRQYSHYFTDDSQDYAVVEEFESFASWQEAVKKSGELEEAAWPDEAEREAFMESMDRYYKDWHGDMLMRSNPALKKNCKF